MIKADIGRLVLCWQKGLADLYRIAASIAIVLVSGVGPGPELTSSGQTKCCVRSPFCRHSLQARNLGLDGKPPGAAV